MAENTASKIFQWLVSGLFLVLLVLGFFFVYKWTERARIDPASYAYAGKIIKEKFPSQYDMYSDDAAGRHLYEKGFITEEQRFVLKSKGLSDEEINNLIVQNPYTREEKIFYYVVFLILWACLYAYMIWSVDKLPAVKNSQENLEIKKAPDA